MIAAYAPDLAGPNDALPPRDSFSAMPETAKEAKRPSGFSDAHAQIEEIEQLYMAGLTTYQIADRLGLRPRDVGRNLRETRKRYQRAARRQTQAMAVSQCAAIQREAMEGWRRSQEQKRAVTTRRRSGEPDVVTTRTEDRLGNNAFLNTALRAMKQLRQIAGEAPAASGRPSDPACLAILEVLTPEQAAKLTPHQVRQFSTALDRWSVLLNTVEDELHPTDAAAQDSPNVEPPIDEPPIIEPRAETEDAAFPADDTAVRAALDAYFGLPEVQAPATADAAASDEAAKDDQTTIAARNDRQQTAKKAPLEPRHPEWPAESFLSRSWLPPDGDFAVNRGENAASFPDALHERNGCAP
jgi:hypothetical protein